MIFLAVYRYLLLTWDMLTQRLAIARKAAKVKSIIGSGALKGRVAVVTGGNAGIGAETVRLLAAGGARVILEKGSLAVANMHLGGSDGQIDVEVLDLSSMQSVRQFAARLHDLVSQVDILVLNAGVMSAPLLGPDSDFPEPHFLTNHLGHFLLTVLLLPLLRRSASARIVSVSSLLCMFGQLDLDDLDFRRRGYDAAQAYTNSKLCNVLFTRELEERLRGSSVAANVVHPGEVLSSIARHLSAFMRWGQKYVFGMVLLRNEGGAYTTLYAAASPDLDGVSGKFLMRVDGELSMDAMPQARDGTSAKLWEVSERLCKLSPKEREQAFGLQGHGDA